MSLLFSAQSEALKSSGLKCKNIQRNLKYSTQSKENRQVQKLSPV